MEGRRQLGTPRVRWAVHLARMGEERLRIGSWLGNRREGEHWGDLGVDRLCIGAYG